MEQLDLLGETLSADASITLSVSARAKLFFDFVIETSTNSSGAAPVMNTT